MNELEHKTSPIETTQRRVGVGASVISDLEKQYVNEVLDSGQLSYGPFSKRFESKLASLHGLSHAVLVNSGTSALHIALAALKECHNWDDSTEVIVPSTTFVASVNVVYYNQLVPVLVDVDSHTYNINANLIEEAITARTRCIMVVHLFGQPCNMDPIVTLAAKYKLQILADSCECMFATYNSQPVGKFADITCFSTYIAHILSTGVGGVAATNNQSYACVMRSLANHGRNNIFFTEKSEANKQEIIATRFQFVRFGFSFRVTEMEAALGCAQLDEAILNRNLTRRSEVAAKYSSSLSKYENILIQLPQPQEVYMMYPVVVLTTLFTKQELVTYLENNGVETRDMLPILNQPIYANRFDSFKYPVSQWLIERGFYVGCNPYMTDKDVTHVLDTLCTFMDPHVTMFP